jgi:hypothetical protein
MGSDKCTKSSNISREHGGTAEMMSTMRCTGVCVSATVLLLTLVFLAPSLSQNKTSTQTSGVDDTRMGSYRALAQLSFQAFGKGDLATAGQLARILERTWDRGEEHGGEKSLGKTDPELFRQIDYAMDTFIAPSFTPPRLRTGQRFELRTRITSKSSN